MKLLFIVYASKLGRLVLSTWIPKAAVHAEVRVGYWCSVQSSSWAVNNPFKSLLLSNNATVLKKVKVAHNRLPSIGFRSWSRFLAVSLQVTWIINPAVGCHYFPPDLQSPSQPLRGLLPISLLGEQRHDWCEHFAYDCYPTASRLQFEPRPFCALVQLTIRLPSHPTVLRCWKWNVATLRLYILAKT